MKKLIFDALVNETASALAGKAVEATLSNMGFDSKSRESKKSPLVPLEFVEYPESVKVFDKHFTPLFPSYGPGISEKAIWQRFARRKVPILSAVQYFKESHTYRHREIAELMDKLKAYYFKKLGESSKEEIDHWKLLIVSLLVTILDELDELVVPGETYKPIMQEGLRRLSKFCANLKDDNELMKSLQKVYRLDTTLHGIVQDIDVYFMHCAKLQSRRVLQDNLLTLSEYLERIDLRLKDLIWLFGVNQKSLHDLTIDPRNIEILQETSSFDEFNRNRSHGDYAGTTVSELITNAAVYDFFRAFFNVTPVVNQKHAESLINAIHDWANLPYHRQHLISHKANLVQLLLKQKELYKLRKDLPKAIHAANTCGASSALFAADEIKGLMKAIETCLSGNEEAGSIGLNTVLTNLEKSAQTLNRSTIQISAGSPFSGITTHASELRRSVNRDIVAVVGGHHLGLTSTISQAIKLGKVKRQLQEGNEELRQLIEPSPSTMVALKELNTLQDLAASDDSNLRENKENKYKSSPIKQAVSAPRLTTTPSSTATSTTEAKIDPIAVTLTAEITTVIDLYREFANENNVNANRHLANNYEVVPRLFKSDLGYLPIVNPTRRFDSPHQKIYKSSVLQQLAGLLKAYYDTKKQSSVFVRLNADQQKIIDHKLLAIGFLLKMIDDLDNRYSPGSLYSETFHKELMEINQFCIKLAKDQTVTDFSKKFRKAHNFRGCLENLQKVIANYSVEYHSAKAQTVFQDKLTTALCALNTTNYNFQKILLRICFNTRIPADILVHKATFRMLTTCDNYADCAEDKAYPGSPFSTIVKDELSFSLIKQCLIKSNSTSLTDALAKQLGLDEKQKESKELKDYVNIIGTAINNVHAIGNCIQNLEKMRDLTDSYGEMTALMAYKTIQEEITKSNKTLTLLEENLKQAERAGVELTSSLNKSGSDLARHIQGISAFLQKAKTQIEVASHSIVQIAEAMKPDRIIEQMGQMVENIESLAEYRADGRENTRLGYVELLIASYSQQHKLAEQFLNSKSHQEYKENKEIKIDQAKFFSHRKKIIHIIKTEIYSILAGKGSEYSLNKLFTTWNQLDKMRVINDHDLSTPINRNQLLLTTANNELVNCFINFNESYRLTLNEVTKLSDQGKSLLWNAIQYQRQMTQLQQLIDLQIRLPKEYKQELNTEYLGILTNLILAFHNDKNFDPSNEHKRKDAFSELEKVTGPASLVNKLKSLRSACETGRANFLKSYFNKITKIMSINIYMNWDSRLLELVKEYVSPERRFIVTNAERLSQFYKQVFESKQEEGKEYSIAKPKLKIRSSELSDDKEYDTTVENEKDSDQEKINLHIISVMENLLQNDILASAQQAKFLNGYRYLQCNPFKDQKMNARLSSIHNTFHERTSANESKENPAPTPLPMSVTPAEKLKYNEIKQEPNLAETAAPMPSVAATSQVRLCSPPKASIETVKNELKGKLPFVKDPSWMKKHSAVIKDVKDLNSIKEYTLEFWNNLLRHLQNQSLTNQLVPVPEDVRNIAIVLHDALFLHEVVKQDSEWRLFAIKSIINLFNDTSATISSAMERLTSCKQELEPTLMRSNSSNIVFC